VNLYRNVDEPDRTGLIWEEIWQGPDRGLIRSWEIGRHKARIEADLAALCKDGELPQLAWKGGVTRTLKKLTRWGSHHYLAQWQGLRGEPLNLDTENEQTVICARTGMIVTFTSDAGKLAKQATETDDEETPDGPAQRIPEQSLLPSGAD